MIPRLSPPLATNDLFAAFKGLFLPDGAKRFEKSFAKWSEKKYALSFSYGRSALYSLIRLMGWKGREIILPAYTCYSIPAVIVDSGNIPKFIDIDIKTFNMNLEEVHNAINTNTAAIIFTYMYGSPLNTNSLKKIADEKGITIIRDYALALKPPVQSTYLFGENEVAIYSFSIGKQITTGEGGMLTTDSKNIFERLKKQREKDFIPLTSGSIKQFFFLAASYIATVPEIYPFTYFLAYKTKILNFLTNHYDKDKIKLPENIFGKLPSCMGYVGENQIIKANDVLEKKREIAKAYFSAFTNLKWLSLPLQEKDINYSHFPCLMEDREKFLSYMLKNGVHLGVEVFDYVASNLPVFRGYTNREYPNSEKIKDRVVLFPLHYRMSDRDLKKIIRLTARWDKKNIYMHYTA